MAKLLASQASESIVLGGLINHLEWILEVTDLRADYFTVGVNKIIYLALKGCIRMVLLPVKHWIYML